MTNSGGIVQDKTESIWGIKALLRKRFQLEGNGALEQVMQRYYRNKHFSEVAWLHKVGLKVPSGPAFLLLFSRCVAKSDLSETIQKPEV